MSAPAVAATPAAPQEANSTGGQTTVRVRVEIVDVPVTVLDKQGRPVIDLTKDDFQIFEDNNRQNIKYFSREMRQPLRIGLILDTSNSARPALGFEKDAASEFVFNMLKGRSSKNKIFLQTFDATSSIIQDFTNDPEQLNEKIRLLKAGGGKALFDAIYFACREKMMNTPRSENARRVLVVVSDGRDVQSKSTIEEAISMARRAETVIYTIGITAYGFHSSGKPILEELSAATGGASYNPLEQTPGTDLATGYLSQGQIGDTSQNKGLGASTGIYSATRLMQLADSLDSIGRELNEQYSIQYTPQNDRADGTYRSIRVEVNRKGYTVRAKAGYFAPSEP
ncbi:MAG: VWA domain-containing protein [Acidobacteria bacterium]|nr:VWA domain-containing protein [Acidobacteriota bacterium]